VPQDIEWAIDRDLEFPKNIVLLQTRAEVIAQKKAPVDQVLDLILRKWT
jgi:pyruvate,water dikinase